MALQTPYNQHSLHESSEKHRNASLALRSHVFKSSNSASEEPVIPRPEIFDQLLKPAPQNFVSPIQIPNASECAVHLKLLHALYELRQNVLHSKSLDDAFDIKPNIRTVWRGYPRRQVKIKDSMFAKKREEKWPIYVKFAVLRFLHWVKKADSALYEAELLGKVEEIGLPPLGMWPFEEKPLGRIPEKRLIRTKDILLVWHSCLLNPRDFSVFCREHSYRHIRNVEFPWSKIVSPLAAILFTSTGDLKHLPLNAPRQVIKWKQKLILIPFLIASLNRLGQIDIHLLRQWREEL